MRRGILVGLDKDGQYRVLSDPSVDVAEQRQSFKDICQAGGKSADLALQELVYFEGPVKVQRFGQQKVTVSIAAPAAAATPPSPDVQTTGADAAKPIKQKKAKPTKQK